MKTASIKTRNRKPARASASAVAVAAPRAAAGRPRDMEKRAAILDAAKNLFLGNGFEGTSMDAIASAAGVSKITVYSHFQDKDTLFREVCKAKCEKQLPHEIFVINRKAPLRQQLLQIARAFFGLIMSPEAIALHRLMTAQQEPKLAQLFWEEGPQRSQHELAEFFRAEIAEGALDIPDPRRAAGHFFCLLKGEPFARVTYGAGGVSEADARAHIESVVDLFLRAYAPR